MSIDLTRTLQSLATTRPVFHSERDFQFALAWQIQSEHAAARVRLETRPSRSVHLDLLITLPDERVAFELKYFVDRSSIDYDGERFDLPNQAAQPLSRYDFVKDIGRCESMIADGYADRAFAIALTNHRGYWNPGRKDESIDAAFKLHQGMILAGTMQWSPATGGTSKGRTDPLVVTGRYTCKWMPYSSIPGTPGKPIEFRYLAIEVT